MGCRPHCCLRVGLDAKGLDASEQLFVLLQKWDVTSYALRINTDGMPAHPLMLSYACTLQPFSMAAMKS
jgi:hypothetical protein